MSSHGQSRTQTHWQETQARICNRNGQHLVTQCDKWADTGSAVMSTVNKGTNAGFVALVRTRWYSKPFLSAQTRLAFSAPTHFWRRGSSVSCMSSEILLLTSYFEHQCQFDARRVFSHEGRKTPIYFRGGFQFPAEPVARLDPSWWQSVASKAEASVVTPVGSTHRCPTGRGQKPDIIDYLLVSSRFFFSNNVKL